MPSRVAFTLVELLVVVTIVAVLMSILLPVFSRSREKSRQATCQSNLHQIWMSVRMYVDSNDGAWPNANAWQHWEELYGSLPHCPSVEISPALSAKGVPGYAINAGLFPHLIAGKESSSSEREEPVTDEKIQFPVTTVALCENRVGEPFQNGFDPRIDQPAGAWVRHNGGSNYAFVDGHLRWYHPESVVGKLKTSAQLTESIGNTGVYPTFNVDPPQPGPQ